MEPISAVTEIANSTPDRLPYYIIAACFAALIYLFRVLMEMVGKLNTQHMEYSKDIARLFDRVEANQNTFQTRAEAVTDNMMSRYEAICREATKAIDANSTQLAMNQERRNRKYEEKV